MVDGEVIFSDERVTWTSLLPLYSMSQPPKTPGGDLADDVYRQAQAGDMQAIEAIVRHYQQPVRTWLAAHCPVGADADEVAQRTFLAAITRIAEFQLGTSFCAWLFAIARYQLMTETTRMRRLADYHARLAPDLLARELERRSGEPDETTIQRLHYLRECLAALNESARQFIEWRYTAEISLEEMAARTGRTTGAIKKQLWMLRRKLQECIEGKLAVSQEGVP
jgi:RNA polymerase sigma-70 factor (ECF subfamily)